MKNKHEKENQKDKPFFETEEDKQKYIEEEMKRIINELNIKDSDLNNDISKRIKRKTLLLNVLRNVLLFLLIISFTGFIDWATFSPFWNIVVFSLTSVMIDLFLNVVIIMFIPKLVFKTLGLIKIIALLLSMYLGYLLVPGVSINSGPLTIVFGILVVVMDIIIKFALTSRQMLLKIKR